MKFSNILKNEHFNNLASIIRTPFHSSQSRPPHFWPLIKKFQAVTPPDGSWNHQEVIAAFTDLLILFPLSYTESDLAWFISLLDAAPGIYKPTVKLLQAWYSAPVI
jgi:hypothetical protein